MSEALADTLQVRPRRLRPYPEYKESGVECLGKIPAHWEVRRLKTIACVQLSNVDKKTLEGEERVRLCNYVDVYYNEHITSGIEFMSATATRDQRRRLALRTGDVLITKDSESWTDIAVPAVVLEDLEDVVCGYHLAHIRPGPSLEGRFLARAVSAIGPRDQFQIAANGITRFGLSADAITGGLFAIPSPQEQLAISDFLDRETAKIDALVVKKERLVELLHEKRTALITRAVTKGLNPEVSLLVTGSAIFPEIPGRWKLRKLRRLIRRVKRPVVVEPETEYREIGIRSWARGIFHKDPLRGALLEDKSIFYIEPEDLVLNIVFAWEGAVAVVSSCELGMVASHRFPTFRHSEEVDLDYLLVILQSEQGRALMGINSPGAAGRNRTIRLEQFLDEEVPLPALDEQREIVAAFRSEEKRLEALLPKIRIAIDRLTELRAALISAAVTGKIDVRKDTAEGSCVKLPTDID